MAKKTVTFETKTVAFEFVEGEDKVIFDLHNVSDDTMLHLALHGASQKIGDSYASAKQACADTEISPDEWSKEQAAGVIAQLIAGDWTVRRAGSAATSSDLAKALAEAVGCTEADAIARLADAEKEDKAALRKHPAVAAVLTRLKAERAIKKADEAEAKADSGPDLTEFMTS